MIITYHGVDFIKVQFGDTVLAVNPISKDSNIKSSRFGADITLISSKDSEHNGADVTSRGDKASFIIDGPGEYEVSNIFIKGFLSHTQYGEGVDHINTIYTVNLEGMNLCFLGAFGEDSLPATAKASTENVDILFVPVGGDGVLDPARAQKIAVQFEPKIIIPTHFDGVGKPDALKIFLKEAGAEDVKPIDKLTIKKKDVDSKEGEVVVLAVSK
jgi:L-ascorbate metabolism protein UlaG (beta-lactamase superfamily)